MHTKNSALAYWCFPRLIKVNLKANNNLFNRIHNKMSNHELMLYLQVAYSSWLLLLWLTSLYLVTGLGSQDDTLRYFLLLPPSIGSSDTIPTMTFPQECDPRHRLACHGLHHPQLPLGKNLSRNKLHSKSMLQVLYIGGSKVSLPDACADVFPPRWRRHICQLEESRTFLVKEVL